MVECCGHDDGDAGGCDGEVDDGRDEDDELKEKKEFWYALVPHVWLYHSSEVGKSQMRGFTDIYFTFSVIKHDFFIHIVFVQLILAFYTSKHVFLIISFIPKLLIEVFTFE